MPPLRFIHAKLPLLRELPNLPSHGKERNANHDQESRDEVREKIRSHQNRDAETEAHDTVEEKSRTERRRRLTLMMESEKR